MRHLGQHRRLVVEAARDHGKSWTFSYAWPLFNVQRARAGGAGEPQSIALISYSEEQARKNLARIRKAIEARKELQWLIPESKAYVWDAGMLNTSNDCVIEAFGFGSSIRGGHYHKVIVDDPSKDHGTMSLDDQINFFFGVIMPAVRRDGQIVVTGNPVGKKDLLEQFESAKGWNVFKYPAIDADGKALWPEQYTVADIEQRRLETPAPHIFLREYMLKRVSANDAKFRQEWIRYYDEKKIAGRPLFKCMTIDPALSPGGDYLAAVVTGTDHDDNTYVIDRLKFRGDFKSGISLLCDMMLRNSPHEIGFENFAFQKMYKIWLEEEMVKRKVNFFIKEVGRDSKRTKAMRIEGLQPKLAGGKLYFRREDSELIDQFLLWDPASKNNDDDLIDALAWQVGLWRRPYDERGFLPSSDSPRPGTFAEALDESRHGQDTWIGKLFEDFTGG